MSYEINGSSPLQIDAVRNALAHKFVPPRGLSIVGISGAEPQAFGSNGYTTLASATVFRTRLQMMTEASQIVLADWNAYSNGTGSNLNYPLGTAQSTPIVMSMSLERLSASGPLVTDGVWTPAPIRGRWNWSDDSQQITYTDLIPIKTTATEVLFSRTKLNTSASFMAVTGILNGGGGASGDGRPPLGEGSSTGGNVTGNIGSSDTNQGGGVNSHRPLAVLGVPTLVDIGPSIALMGDSILGGIGDASLADINPAKWAHLCVQGFGARAAIAAGIPYVNMAASGSKLSDWATDKWIILRDEMISYAPGVLISLGTNDLGSVTATMQANLLKIASRCLARYQNIAVATIMPKATSSDFYATYANQSPALGSTNNEFQRRNWNRWLRDTTATSIITNETPQGVTDGSNTTFWTRYGFSGTPTVTVNGGAVTPTIIDASGGRFTVASAPVSGATILVTYNKIIGAQPQLQALAPLGLSQVKLADIAAAIEYNNSGNLIDVNSYSPLLSSGGCWPQAQLNSGSVNFRTGTLTTSGTTAWSDTSDTSPANTWQNYSIYATSGAVSGLGTTLTHQNTAAYAAGAMYNGVSFPNASVGDNYAIRRPPTIDGTHPTPWVHALAAAAISSILADISRPN